MPRIFVPDHVENADAYIRAAEARIAANRCKGNRKRWEEESGLEVVTRCIDFLSGTGEFARIDSTDEDGTTVIGSHPHPLVKISYGDFYTKMGQAINDWGRLSPGQERAVLAMIERAEQRVAERAKKRAEEAAASQWIGKVGERIEITATIIFVTSYETQFGVTVVTGLRDDAGNMLIQKGVGIGYKGEKIVVRATVKEHGERDGMKQTILSRPKVLDIIETEEEA